MTDGDVQLLMRAYMLDDWVSVVEVSHSLKGVCAQIGGKFDLLSSSSFTDIFSFFSFAASRAAFVLNRVYLGAKADIPVKSSILDAIEKLRVVLRDTCAYLEI